MAKAKREANHNEGKATAMTTTRPRPILAARQARLKAMQARNNADALSILDSIRHPTLTGILFKCAASHQWEAAVGGVWLQMPYCPECHRLTNQRHHPVAWIGIWNKVQP